MSLFQWHCRKDENGRRAISLAIDSRNIFWHTGTLTSDFCIFEKHGTFFSINCSEKAGLSFSKENTYKGLFLLEVTK
ncbi:MAG: hypothetical protein C4554_09205 [Dethiobacter sp.]|jgi:hypothetical protein|nr:MAG: hypothetical protein C4554_09205 [Dethiobacter sp.]